MLSYKFQNDETEDDYDNAYNDKPLTNNLSKFKEEDDY
jgi:agmatinase